MTDDKGGEHLERGGPNAGDLIVADRGYASQFFRPMTGRRSCSSLMLLSMGISGRLAQTSRKAHWLRA